MDRPQATGFLTASTHSFFVKRNNSLYFARNSTCPRKERPVELLRIEHLEHTINRIMRRNLARKFEKSAQSSISFQVSIPQITAIIAMVMIAMNLCLWLYRALGFGTSIIHPISEVSFFVVSINNYLPSRMIEIIIHDCVRLVFCYIL